VGVLPPALPKSLPTPVLFRCQCRTITLRDFITGLRGSSSRCEAAAEPVSTSTSRTLPSLITESENVGDDWLIDDVRGLKRKRTDMDNLFKDVNIRTEKKRNSQQRTYTGRMSDPSHLGDVELRTPVYHEDHSLAEQIFDGDRASPESTMILNDEMAADSRGVSASVAALHRRKQSRLIKSGGIVPAAGQQVSAGRKKVESSVQNVTSTTVIKPPPPSPLKMRLKIRIGDQLILVPILERSASYCCCELVLCEYSKFRIESNSYFSIRFDSKRVQLFEIFEYLPSPISYLFNRMTPIFHLSNHA